jgi:hypothetical protein
MATLQTGQKVLAVVNFQEYPATVVSSEVVGDEGLKYTVVLDTPINYGWDNSPRTEFTVSERFIRGI